MNASEMHVNHSFFKTFHFCFFQVSSSGLSATRYMILVLGVLFFFLWYFCLEVKCSVFQIIQDIHEKKEHVKSGNFLQQIKNISSLKWTPFFWKALGIVPYKAELPIMYLAAWIKWRKAWNNLNRCFGLVTASICL